MKHIIALILMTVCASPALAYNVCGPDVVGRDYSYLPGYVGAWAVGDGCDGETENSDVATMCTTVIAGGQSYCSSVLWGTTDLDEETAAYGNHCYCRRTKMQVGGELTDTVGQWVMLGLAATSCEAKCAMYCAENVANDIGGFRNAIMILPAF